MLCVKDNCMRLVSFIAIGNNMKDSVQVGAKIALLFLMANNISSVMDNYNVIKLNCLLLIRVGIMDDLTSCKNPA